MNDLKERIIELINQENNSELLDFVLKLLISKRFN